MSIVSWFWFFVAVFLGVSAFYFANKYESAKEENRTLRSDYKYAYKELMVEHNRAEYFRAKCEENKNFFDFEKVNGKKEK